MVTVWKGAVNFGLINIPVKLSTAIKKETISFRGLHKKCKTPLNQKRWCANCNTEVAYKDVIKGYEYEKGLFVEITSEDLDTLPVRSAKYIQIADFIKLEEIDPIYFDKAYYLVPEKNGEKPYLILYDAMNETKRAAIAKVSIREKEYLCVIRVYNDILILNTMFFAEEIKSTAEIDTAKLKKKANISKTETDMAKQIISNLTAEFDPEKYRDEYREELVRIINAKIEGKEVIQPKIPEMQSEMFVDLLDKLKQSVEMTSSSSPN